MYRRISFNNNLSSFWVEKTEDGYRAYKTFQDAVRGLVSIDLMLSLGQDGLQAAYFSLT